MTLVRESILKPKSKEEIQKEIYSRDYRPHKILKMGLKIGSIDVVKYAYELNKNEYNNEYISEYDEGDAITEAIKKDHLNIIKYILKDKIKSEKKEPLNSYYIYLATKYNRFEILKFLLENFEFDLSDINDALNSIKFSISKNDDIENILKKYKDSKLLKESILKPKSKKEIRKEIFSGKYNLDKILLYGAKVGLLDIVEYALNQDLKNTSKFIDYVDILHALYIASKKGHKNIFEYIFDEYSNSNDISNVNIGTMLYNASCGGHLNIVKYLIDNFNLDMRGVADSIRISLDKGYEDITKILEDYRDKIEKEQGF